MSLGFPKAQKARNSTMLPAVIFKNSNARLVRPPTAQTANVAWQHILLNGHYTFQNSNELIDLDTLVADLKPG